MADQNFTFTAETGGVEAKIADLRKQVVALQQAMRDFGGNQTSMQGFVRQIDETQAKIRELQLQLAGVSTTSSAMADRMRVPFAAVANEIKTSTAAAEKFVEAHLRIRAEMERRLPDAAAGVNALGIAAAERASNDALAAKEKFLKATANDAAVYYANIKQAEQVEQRLADAAKGVAAMAVQRTQTVNQEAQEAKAQLNKNLVNDAAQQVAGQKQVQAALGTTATAHRNVGAAARTGAHEAADGSDIVISGMRRIITVGDELSRGQRGQFFSTLGATLKDLGLGVGGLATAFGALLAGGVIIRVMTTLAEWNHQLATLAEKQVNLAAAAGVDVVAFNNLSAAAHLVSGDTELAARALEMLQRQMQQASDDPTSAAMENFRKLGLTWEEIHNQVSQPGGSLNVLRELSDAYVHLGQTARTNAAFTGLFGVREFAQIIPLLRQGSDGIDTLIQRSKDLGSALDESTIKTLEQVEQKIHNLDAAWTGFKVSVASGDLFTKNIEALTTMLTVLSGHRADVDALSNMFDRVGNLIGAGNPLGGIFQGIGAFTRARGAATEAPASGVPAIIGSSHGMAVGGGFKPRTEGDEWLVQNAPFPTTAKPAGAGAALDTLPWTDKLPSPEAYGEPKGESIGPGLRIGDPGPMGASKLGQSLEAPGVSFDEAHLKTYEQLYEAQLKAAEAAAERVHNEAAINKVLEDREKFARMGPDEKADFLKNQPGFSIGQAAATQQTQITQVTAEGAARRAQIEREHFDAQMADFAKQKVAAKGNATEISAIEEKEAAARMAFAQTSAAGRIQAETQVMQAKQAATAQSIKEAEMELSTHERINTAKLKEFESEQKAARERGQISSIQEYNNNMMKAIELEKELEAELNKINATPGILKDQAQALDEKLRVLREQLKQFQDAQIEKATAAGEKVAKAWAEPFQKAFSNLSGGIESAISGAISRSETPKAAVKKLFEAGVKDAVDVIGTTLSKVIAKSFMNATAGESMGQMFSKMLGHLFETEAPLKLVDEAGKLATAANTISTTTNTAALAANTAAQASGAAGSAASGVGGIFGFIPKLFGLFAAQGGIVPSAAGGMIAGGGSLAILHPREMVLPAYLSTGIQNMMQGNRTQANTNNNSTSGTVNYSPTINGGGNRMSRADMDVMLRDHGDRLVKHVQNHFRNNGSMRFAH